MLNTLGTDLVRFSHLNDTFIPSESKYQSDHVDGLPGDNFFAVVKTS